MANKKITELTEETSPQGADLLALVDDVSGTPTTKKVTVTNLMGQAPVQSVAGKTGTVTLSNTDISGLGTAATSASTDFSPAFFSTVSETTTARTLSDSDNGKVITCTNSGFIYITVPSSLTSGFSCTVVQEGQGKVTIQGSGASVYGLGGNTATQGQYASINIINIGTNKYLLDGDLTTSPFVNGQSILFDGTDDYMTAPHDSTINNSTFTLSYWFKHTGGSGYRNILAKRGGSGLGLFQTGIDTSSKVFYLGGNTPRAHSTSPTINTWNHVAIVQRTGSDVDIVLNGNTQNFAEPAGNTSETGAISVGRTMNATPGYYTGYVDEVALFTSALSTSDVAALRDTTGSNPVPADLTSLSPWAWYRMGDSDGGAGSTITDLGSGGNDGTLFNTPTHSTDIPS